MWDNRCTLHRPIMDYDAGATPRIMHRLTITAPCPPRCLNQSDRPPRSEEVTANPSTATNSPGPSSSVWRTAATTRAERCSR
ncbi:MAG: hypothetical protein ACRDTT_05775, partial [Pseudonocardiaceae bacterium]